MIDYKMNLNEIRVTVIMCLILSCRMIGIFMITPAINTTGIFFEEQNKLLIGCVFGVYGFMQTIFQIPFGLIADKIGYKKTILLGLSIFFLGSFIPSINNSIWLLILGRALQGISAISSLSISFLGTCIREQNFTKSISLVGISFGVSFLFSIVIGPIIITLLGLQGVFIFISFLSVISIFLFLYFIIPYNTSFFLSNKKKMIRDYFFIFQSYDILGYFISVFFLHFLLTINFIIIPKQMELLGYLLYQHSKIYFLVVFFSLIISAPIIFYSEIKFYIRSVMIISIFTCMISEILFLFFYLKYFLFFLSMQFFFIAFILSESFLPSLLNKISPIKYKSFIMSCYSTSQFFGIACGGILGGLIYNFYGIQILCLLGFLFSFFWFLIFYFISPPIYSINISIKINNGNIYNSDFKKKINSFPGIISFRYSISDQFLYLKINSQITSKLKIENMIKNNF